ncbi:hypothetical protein HDV00_008032 [Rhizophlyctis rosea]|nr:hypothetical protein HDV00_008032 [Rhizophlyctis rosea]
MISEVDKFLELCADANIGYVPFLKAHADGSGREPVGSALTASFGHRLQRSLRSLPFVPAVSLAPNHPIPTTTAIQVPGSCSNSGHLPIDDEQLHIADALMSLSTPSNVTSLGIDQASILTSTSIATSIQPLVHLPGPPTMFTDLQTPASHPTLGDVIPVPAASDQPDDKFNVIQPRHLQHLPRIVKPDFGMTHPSLLTCAHGCLTHVPSFHPHQLIDANIVAEVEEDDYINVGAHGDEGVVYWMPKHSPLNTPSPALVPTALPYTQPEFLPTRFPFDIHTNQFKRITQRPGRSIHSLKASGQNADLFCEKALNMTTRIAMTSAPLTSLAHTTHHSAYRFPDNSPLIQSPTPLSTCPPEQFINPSTVNAAAAAEALRDRSMSISVSVCSPSVVSDHDLDRDAEGEMVDSGNETTDERETEVGIGVAASKVEDAGGAGIISDDELFADEDEETESVVIAPVTSRNAKMEVAQDAAMILTSEDASEPADDSQSEVASGNKPVSELEIAPETFGTNQLECEPSPDRDHVTKDTSRNQKVHKPAPTIRVILSRQRSAEKCSIQQPQLDDMEPVNGKNLTVQTGIGDPLPLTPQPDVVQSTSANSPDPPLPQSPYSVAPSRDYFLESFMEMLTRPHADAVSIITRAITIVTHQLNQMGQDNEAIERYLAQCQPAEEKDGEDEGEAQRTAELSSGRKRGRKGGRRLKKKDMGSESDDDGGRLVMRKGKGVKVKAAPDITEDGRRGSRRRLAKRLKEEVEEELIEPEHRKNGRPGPRTQKGRARMMKVDEDPYASDDEDFKSSPRNTKTKADTRKKSSSIATSTPKVAAGSKRPRSHKGYVYLSESESEVSVHSKRLREAKVAKQPKRAVKEGKTRKGRGKNT